MEMNENQMRLRYFKELFRNNLENIENERHGAKVENNEQDHQKQLFDEVGCKNLFRIFVFV